MRAFLLLTLYSLSFLFLFPASVLHKSLILVCKSTLPLCSQLSRGINYFLLIWIKNRERPNFAFNYCFVLAKLHRQQAAPSQNSPHITYSFSLFSIAKMCFPLLVLEFLISHWIMISKRPNYDSEQQHHPKSDKKGEGSGGGGGRLCANSLLRLKANGTELLSDKNYSHRFTLL